MSDYSAEDRAKDDGERFKCHDCGHIGTSDDFYGCDPEEMEGGIRLCDECFFNPPAASNVNHPFCQLLQFSGRDS